MQDEQQTGHQPAMGWDPQTSPVPQDMAAQPTTQTAPPDHQLPVHGTPDHTPVWESPEATHHLPPRPQPLPASSAGIVGVNPETDFGPPAPPVRPEAPAGLSQPGNQLSDLPVPVVQVLSVRGVEYVLMTLLLWFGAGGLLAMILSLINGGTDFESLAFPLSLLLVTLPGFAFFFVRLKRAELANPALRFDASKRRLSQFTQVITFAIVLFTTIGLVYSLLAAVSGEDVGSLWSLILNILVVDVIAGGIFVYYWFDEHRLKR